MHTPDQGNTQAAATARTGWRRPTYTAPHTVSDAFTVAAAVAATP